MGLNLVGPEDACECRSLPVMWWLVPGEPWFVGSIAWDGPAEMVEQMAVLDRMRADLYGVTEFKCVCPECGLTMASGELE